MRERLLRAPWWAHSLLGGFLWTLLTTLNELVVADRSWAQAVVPAVLGGVVFGAVGGPLVARDHRRVIEAAGYLPPGRLGRAVRLARRGAVPEDPALRSAARQIALDQRDQMLRQRRWFLPLVGLLLVLFLFLALSGGGGPPVVWLALVLLSGLVAAHLLMARHLAQRAELLGGPPS